MGQPWVPASGCVSARMCLCVVPRLSVVCWGRQQACTQMGGAAADRGESSPPGICFLVIVAAYGAVCTQRVYRLCFCCVAGANFLAGLCGLPLSPHMLRPLARISC